MRCTGDELLEGVTNKTTRHFNSVIYSNWLSFYQLFVVLCEMPLPNSDTSLGTQW